MATIVVGIEDSLRAQDAVALAGTLARLSGAALHAVFAYPYDRRPSAHYNASMHGPLREAAEAVLERICEPLSDLPAVRRLAVADPAPARALLAAAAAANAAVIVVGSSHSGHDGRVRPGGTGRRLLQGAPCAVAIAPRGHRLRPRDVNGRVTAALDGAPAALPVAAALARAADASLRVVTVFAPDAAPPTWLRTPPGFPRLTDDAERAARARLERAVERLPAAETAFLVGDPAREIALESEVADLLVAGSRSYGPSPVVLLGGVTEQLVRTAACPVLIVPNGPSEPLSRLFDARGELRTRAAA